MDQRIETSIVVKGLSSADQLHRALTEFVNGEVAPPAFAGDEWWFLYAPLPHALPEEVVLALSPSPALLLQGAGAEVGLVATAEDGVVTWLIWGPLADPMEDGDRVETSDHFVEWTKRHAPKPLTTKTAQDLWDSLRGYDGHEFVRAVLEELGWQRFGPVEGWELLGECIEPASLFSQYQFVGEVKVDWESVRFVTGYGSDFVGIWDRERPKEPIRRWPKDRDGLRAAREFQRRKIDDEIIAATVLSGTRAWADLKSHDEAPAAFVHLAQAGHGSIFLATDPPRTIVLTERGFLRTGANFATAMGFMDEMSVRMVEIPIGKIEDVQQIADFYLDAHGLGTWRPVPSSVPKGLVETANWVAQEALKLKTDG